MRNALFVTSYYKQASTQLEFVCVKRSNEWMSEREREMEKRGRERNSEREGEEREREREIFIASKNEELEVKRTRIQTRSFRVEVVVEFARLMV